jgi:hypothetical protein
VTAVVVLAQHDGERTAFARQPGTLQRRKQHLFLLDVMAAVGEVADQIGEPDEHFRPHRTPGFHVPRCGVEAREHALDQPGDPQSGLQ